MASTPTGHVSMSVNKQNRAHSIVRERKVELKHCYHRVTVKEISLLACTTHASGESISVLTAVLAVASTSALEAIL